MLLNGTELVAEAVTLGLRPEVRSPKDGFGVLGSPPPVPVAAAQAREAVRIADGVVQGASVVRRLLDEGPDAVGDYVAEVRAAIDQ